MAGAMGCQGSEKAKFSYALCMKKGIGAYERRQPELTLHAFDIRTAQMRWHV